ncbi:MAG: spore photoproduct lyase [Tissierellia bacterium]|nr:spore photoproduct lyase [Tissierellia bacterium]MDD4781330.1 spore photoproduct lyase [Tissierellia bacterium]
MKLFMPQRVIFDTSSLEYPLGKEIYLFFKEKNVEIVNATARNAARFIPGITHSEKYANSKRTMLITTNKINKLDVCKPSADYQFSIVGNCPGNCEYCYLQTTQGAKPYIKVFVNLDDIFNVIKDYIKQNEGKITTFEVASLGDPLALEHITGSLAKTIDFFSGLENGRLRIVTKYDNVDSLLKLNHNKNAEFRISINSNYVIENFEHNTAKLDERIEAIIKLANAGYPIGFLVAPIMQYENWKEEYGILFQKLEKNLGIHLSKEKLVFELIQHRFTAVAKELILQRFPKTKLDMDEENRTLKWGRFGRYKYVYPKEEAEEIKQYMFSLILERFPNADIKYFT